MDIERYTPQGRIDRTCGLRADQANTIYESFLPMVITPFTRYYRVTLVDPLAGGRIVRDTDHEIFGRSTMVPAVRYHA